MKLRRIAALTKAVFSTLTGFSRTGYTANVAPLPEAERVLVLAPHADDETIGCGGVIKKYSKAGKFVEVVILTDGRLGDPEIRAMRAGNHRDEREAALVALRKKEAQAAADLLGVSKLTFLDAADGQLSAFDTTFLDALSQRFEDTRPDIVFVPFFLDAHPDHFAANVCLDAVSQKLALHKNMLCAAYEIWSPVVAANTLINISDQATSKWQAIAVYQSQLKDVDYMNGIQGLNRYRAVTGLLPNGAYAEAFFIALLSDYLDYYRQYVDA